MRLVPANLDIVFEEVGERESEFLREFDKLSGNVDKARQSKGRHEGKRSGDTDAVSRASPQI